jgi:putative tricarboxylic transport membrane protein
VNEAADTARWRFDFNRIAAIFSVVLSLALFAIIPHQIDKPMVVLADSGSSLSAELFPRIVASAFLLLGIWYFFRSRSLAERNGFHDLDREAAGNVLITFAAMAVYVPLMVNLGFVAASAILIAFLSTFFGNRNFYLTALVSIVIPIIIFFLFTRLLLTSLPPFPVDTVLTRYSIL